MSYTCPDCGKTSQHPEDEKQGYCANCHEFKGEPLQFMAGECRFCGDGTNDHDDPYPDVCLMCAKAGRAAPTSEQLFVAANEAMMAIAHLHNPGHNYQCRECGKSWICPTRAIANAFMFGPALPEGLK